MKSAHSRSTSARAVSRRCRAKRITRARMFQALLQERNVSDYSEKKTTNSAVALCRGRRVFERSGSNRLGYKKCLNAPPRVGPASCGVQSFLLLESVLPNMSGPEAVNRIRNNAMVPVWCQKILLMDLLTKQHAADIWNRKSSVLITRPARVTRGLL